MTTRASLFMVLGSMSCAEEPLPCVPDVDPPDLRAARNVVVVVLDDIGVDRVNAYGVHPDPPATPRLDALSAQGARFVSAYSEPLCSSARAALLTGRRPVHNGIGSNVEGDRLGLADAEVVLPEALKRVGPYTTMAVGKWHLAPMNSAAPHAPLRQGFDAFDGILANPQITMNDGFTGSYFRWENDLDGHLSYREEYLVTAQANAAIEAIETLPEPWFLYVALSGAHGPLHVPPEDLWQVADPVDDRGMGDAMVEATDHELGRIVDAAAGRATLIVVGDNGTEPGQVTPPADPDRSKHTVYAGGTQVPLILVDPELGVSVEDALVHTTDIFPTVIELAGGDPAELDLPLDGVSLLRQMNAAGSEQVARSCVMTEFFGPNLPTDKPETIAVHDRDYTLVRNKGDPDELYVRAPLAATEGLDLLKEGSMDEASRDALRRLRRILRYDR